MKSSNHYPIHRSRLRRTLHTSPNSTPVRLGVVARKTGLRRKNPSVSGGWNGAGQVPTQWDAQRQEHSKQTPALGCKEQFKSWNGMTWVPSCPWMSVPRCPALTLKSTYGFRHVFSFGRQTDVSLWGLEALCACQSPLGSGWGKKQWKWTKQPSLSFQLHTEGVSSLHYAKIKFIV